MITIHPKTRRGKRARSSCRSILAPMDFSKASIAALAWTAALATQLGAKVTLVHVIEPIEFARSFRYRVESDDLDAACREWLLKVARQQLPGAALLRSVMVRHGRAFQEIVETAKELESDLIVMARRGNAQFEHAFMGSVTDRVVRFAPCPVLVLNS